jgi:hypothetical protein
MVSSQYLSHQVTTVAIVYILVNIFSPTHVIQLKINFKCGLFKPGRVKMMAVYHLFSSTFISNVVTTKFGFHKKNG